MRIERLSFQPFNLPGMGNAPAAPAVEELPPTEPVAPEPDIPDPKRFTEEDLAAARQEGYIEGLQAGEQTGRREARAETDEINRQLALVGRHIAQRLTDLQSDYRTYLETQSEEVTKLAIVGARKIAGAALAENPLDDIKAMVEDCLLALVDTPNITVTVHPLLAKVLEKQLENTLSSAGESSAEVSVMTDPSLAMEDCRIEWKNGGAERSVELLWQRVESIMGQYRPMSATPFKTPEASDEAAAEADDKITILRNPHG